MKFENKTPKLHDTKSNKNIIIGTVLRFYGHSKPFLSDSIWSIMDSDNVT